jgi:hypothetical protein
MPCAHVPRGITDNLVQWSDWTDNNPCGMKAVTSVAGVNVAAENLCFPHWVQKWGQPQNVSPVVIEP